MLNRRSAQSEFDAASKRAQLEESAMGSNIDGEKMDGVSGAERTMREHVFKPLYLISSSFDPNTATRQILHAINLP